MASTPNGEAPKQPGGLESMFSAQLWRAVGLFPPTAPLNCSRTVFTCDHSEEPSTSGSGAAAGAFRMPSSVQPRFYTGPIDCFPVCEQPLSAQAGGASGFASPTRRLRTGGAGFGGQQQPPQHQGRQRGGSKPSSRILLLPPVLEQPPQQAPVAVAPALLVAEQPQPPSLTLAPHAHHPHEQQESEVRLDLDVTFLACPRRRRTMGAKRPRPTELLAGSLHHLLQDGPHQQEAAAAAAAPSPAASSQQQEQQQPAVAVLQHQPAPFASAAAHAAKAREASRGGAQSVGGAAAMDHDGPTSSPVDVLQTTSGSTSATSSGSVQSADTLNKGRPVSPSSPLSDGLF